ncbi:hypothetical protein [Mobilicoccus pelagius]|uniref:Gram-positive cocci surface proteins LPxTG domain-containing protein n=1 Tax=Mobilicoccus pelagius NBRC 104925 TaxID=1089455 RepID=H5UQ61_9MICO|nr:hypothetical protein [Mobilicoccus pelagius]GAB47866.1 hypothetical protein MOPEL_029_01490 [Mobilicoccus pelagius NBRC 104925]
MTRPISLKRLSFAVAAGALAATAVSAPAQALPPGSAPAGVSVVAASMPADTSTPTTPAGSETPVELKSTSDPVDPEREVSQDPSQANTMWWALTAVGAIAIGAMAWMMRRRRGQRG